MPIKFQDQVKIKSIIRQLAAESIKNNELSSLVSFIRKINPFTAEPLPFNIASDFIQKAYDKLESTFSKDRYSLDFDALRTFLLEALYPEIIVALNIALQQGDIKISAEEGDERVSEIETYIREFNKFYGDSQHIKRNLKEFERLEWYLKNRAKIENIDKIFTNLKVIGFAGLVANCVWWATSALQDSESIKASSMLTLLTSILRVGVTGLSFIGTGNSIIEAIEKDELVKEKNSESAQLEINTYREMIPPAIRNAVESESIEQIYDLISNLTWFDEKEEKRVIKTIREQQVYLGKLKNQSNIIKTDWTLTPSFWNKPQAKDSKFDEKLVSAPVSMQSGS